MSKQPWEESEELEEEEAGFPIAIVRSPPIWIRFQVRGQADDAGTRKLVTYFRDRRLAQRPVTPDELKEIHDSTARSEPVPVVGLARYSPGGDTLLLSLRAETAARMGPFDSDEAYVWLGYRYRARERQAFPGDLDREARDLFGSLLQGRPDAAIAKLFDDARKDATWRHEYRREHDGHEPGRDIAEGLWRNRIRQPGGDR